MADERADRLYKRKRLYNPNDRTQYIDIPVIYTATFKTMAEQAQERAWYIKNGIDGGTREVRVQQVRNPHDATMRIDVERIQSMITKTTTEQAQEHRWYIKNTEPPPATAPDGELIDDPSHELKHFVRYIGKNAEQDDEEIWCDVELIDVLKIKCTTEQAQEYLLYAKWPDPAQQDAVSDSEDPFQPLTIAICNPELELLVGQEVDSEGNVIDPPYRLDPFQNIVNIHWSTATSPPPEQLFFFRWFPSPSVVNGVGGDWYPMTPEMYDSLVHASLPEGYLLNPRPHIINLGTTAEVILSNSVSCGHRQKRSELINAALTLSDVYDPAHPEIASGGFFQGWVNVQSGPVHRPEPHAYGSPPHFTHDGKGYQYIICGGGYDEDDLDATGEEGAYIDGVLGSTGAPPFTPP